VVFICGLGNLAVAELGKIVHTSHRQNVCASFEGRVRQKQIICSLSLFLMFAVSSRAQGQYSVPHTERVDGSAAQGGEDDSRERLARDMAKKANLERQAALRSDTDKLVKLAGELKGYVEKSNENILSMDVLKKAEEIEKLAHSVKDKMKGPN
jgi:hypothetical protein